jgi:hypothetical protein
MFHVPYRRPFGAAALVLALTCAIASAQPAPTTKPANPIPTTAQLWELHAAKQYRLCLQQAVRASNLTGEMGKKYDKYELMLLRGDCLLHLEDPESALNIFEAARKSPNSRQAIEASATVQVIKRSPLMKFRPKAGGEPISIIEIDDRHKAMVAMLADDLATNAGKIKAAIQARNLVPILAILPTMLDMYALEMAGTEKDTQTRADMAAMGEQARELIAADLKQTDQRVGGIESLANQQVNIGWSGGWWYDGAARRGLHTDDRRNLRDTIQYLGKVEDTLERAHSISHELQGKTEKWEELLTRAAEVRIHAENVLAAE